MYRSTSVKPHWKQSSNYNYVWRPTNKESDTTEWLNWTEDKKKKKQGRKNVYSNHGSNA